MIEGRDIVCFSTADWDTPLPTNKHQIMTRLARRNRVMFVETLGTRTVRWGSGMDWSRIVRRLRRGMRGPRRIHPVFWPVGSGGGEAKGGDRGDRAVSRNSGLWVLSPLVIPRWSSPAIAWFNRAVLRSQLLGAVRRLRFRRPIVWCYSPHAVWALEYLRPRAVLYHMVDDLSSVPGAESEVLRQAEAALLQEATHVICTEAELHRYARRYHPLPVLMENVADFEHFHVAGDASRLSARAKSALAEIQRLPSPRLVFSGHLAPHKVDFDLLLAIKSLRPKWSLILIGPEWEGAELPESFTRLKRQPGVLLTGKIDYGELPAVLHAADVLLIPYQINSVTRHVSPLKFFEYLSTGKPVVATPLPSILKYAGQAGIAATPEGFVEEIERALADPESRQETRLDLARSHTWERRLAEISELLNH